MRTLLAPTEDFIKGAKTSLEADVAAGSNIVLTVTNNNGFTNADWICIGRPGSETSELVQISAAVTSGTSITINSITKAHKKGEPITQFKYNQRKFYGSTTVSGTYTELSGSPKTIQVDNPQGTILEYTGSTYLYFKSTYYNSATSIETDVTSSEAVEGDESGRYTSIYAIKLQAGLVNNPYISDSDVERKRREAEGEINSYIMSRYSLPLTNSTTGAEEVPWMIENVATLLAAGYMDYQEFGAEGEGVKWLGEARSLLKKIRDGEQILVGTDNNQLSTVTRSSAPSSYPDGVDNENGPTQHFSVDMRF